MNPVRNYLFPSGPYVDRLRLRWGVEDNVLEQGGSRSIWAFAEEVAAFLDGFVSQRPLIHFGQVLHLMQLLREKPANTSSERGRLWRLFSAQGGSLRNAGAFCAQLARASADAVEAGSVLEITQRLRRRDVTIHWFLLEGGGGEANWPPVPWEEFEQAVLAELARFSDEAAAFWLRHGRGPVQPAGEAVARELPASLVERLQTLLERPRLQGAGAFVAQLSGALALPPRRLKFQDLPLGGFTDVTTRGKIEDVLPSQFALDEDDFFRRYAEHELLFFRREDPSAQTRQELVVLLDQGVRTWGDIRLVLTAAVLALARHAAARKMPFFLATSALPQVIDPARMRNDELGAYLETTDLSLQPAQALEKVFAHAADCPRDIVLLTHPRNLRDDQLRTAAKAVSNETRLFALTLDRLGQAELSELRRGCPLPIRQFNVDFSQAKAEEASMPRNYSTWTGDVEALGFPFGFGIHGRIPAQGFDFDVAEKHLLTTCKEGLLHLWNMDGSLTEMLPRANYQGAVIRRTSQVLSVPGGFIVLGQTNDGQWVVAHYQPGKRHCQVHPLNGEVAHLEYAATFHCLIVTDSQGAGCALDLANGERFGTSLGGGTERTRAAWEAWEQGDIPRRDISVSDKVMHRRDAYLLVIPQSGVANFFPAHLKLGPFCPVADGKALLFDHTLTQAQRGGDTLVMRLVDRGNKLFEKNQLAVFRKDGHSIKTLTTGSNNLGFRLSSGGGRLAHQTSVSVVQFGSLAATECRQTTLGGYSQNLRMTLTNSGLYIFPGTGELYHHLCWNDGVLVHDLRHAPDAAMQLPSFRRGLMQPMNDHWRKDVDTERWTHWAQHDRLLVVKDRFGQVAVFEQHLERKLVCMFFAFRRRLAGWLPDGTYFGPALMTGNPAHADAMARFGKALYNAAHGGLHVTTGLDDA